MIRSFVRPVSVLASFAIICCGLAGPAMAQPTELFFSEYIEGSSNNKALEIFNGTSLPVNLGANGYNVQMYFNGSAAAGLTINLVGTIAVGDVFVLAQSSAAAAILAVADQTNASGWFNGNDAVVLRKGTIAIDIIGQVGSNPGTEWGTGLTSTADNTLRRKLTVSAGDPDGSNPFNPADEWDGFAINTFGFLGCHSGDLACPPPPPPPLKEIFEIQGSGLTSPFAGQAVETTDNVVTAVDTNGFFIQTPDSRADADPASSNGIFVFTLSAPIVAVGDQVDVVGVVVEFFNLTEIDPSKVTVDFGGEPLPAIVDFDGATPSPNQPQPATELERYEGMRVRVENGLVTGPSDRFGDVRVIATAGPRTFREPGISFPGLPGLPVWDGNPEVFDLDPDGLLPVDPTLVMFAGQTFSAEGVLGFAFGDYSLLPTSLDVGPAPDLPVAVREREEGEFTIATQNVLRLFDTVDDPAISDPAENSVDPLVYAGRLAKLSFLVREDLGAPDLLVVQEAENLTVLEDLATQILADDPALAYTAHLLEGNDIGGIDIGFLVRNTVDVDSLTQFGLDDTFVFNSTTFILNDRPPLVLTGSYVGHGVPFPFTVIGVHQRSLGGIESAIDGPRVREKRHQQALRLSQFIQSLQTGDPAIRLVVIGDFNGFEFSDGYVDVLGQVTGNLDPAGALVTGTDEVNPDLKNHTLDLAPAERYSFVFDGSAQSLDHAVTSVALDPFLRGAEHARGNADTPVALGGDFTTSLHTSDHDATVVYIMSDDDADGLPDDVDSCLGTAIPEATVPSEGLGTNRFALTNGDLVFDTVTPNGEPPTKTFTLADTRGCSCEQIIDRLGLGDGHRKKGCSSGAIEDWIAGLPGGS